MIRRARKTARRKCKRCGRLIATASELSRSYDKLRTDRCYVVWSMRDLGLRPAQMKMVMSPAVKAMARELAVTRSRERLVECNAAHYLRAVKLLIDAIAEAGT